MHPIFLIILLFYPLPFFPIFSTAHEDEALMPTNATSVSPWMLRSIKNGRFPDPGGCRHRPWICNRGSRCCRNRCIDVTSDVNNCGRCRRRCRFTRQCCGGFCVNTNCNPFHCGRCWHQCRFPIRCIFGMCGYAQL